MTTKPRASRRGDAFADREVRICKLLQSRLAGKEFVRLAELIDSNP